MQVASFRPRGRGFGGEEGAENVNAHNIHTFMSQNIFMDCNNIAGYVKTNFMPSQLQNGMLNVKQMRM